MRTTISVSSASEQRLLSEVAPSEPSVAELHVRGVVDAFSGRKRLFLVALTNGQSKSMAAASAGVTPRATQYWARNDPAFAEAAEAAERYGFATVIEAELYRRALAGPDDRSSMRALELIVKARDPSYREKSRAELEVTGIPEAIARFSPARLGVDIRSNVDV